jgi:hypothetical protein
MLVVWHGFELQNLRACACACADESAQGHVEAVERSARHEADDEAAAFAGDSGELLNMRFHATKMKFIFLPKNLIARQVGFLTGFT